MSEISTRVSKIAESATLAVDAKAKALKAEGKPVIGFGAGEPDFPTPPHVVEAAKAAAENPANHRYTPASGLPDLRTAIAEATSRDDQIQVSADQVVVTNGGKQAIFNTMATLINPGDEVIIQAPYWVTYPEVVQVFGGVPKIVMSDETTNYKVTVKELEKARSLKTKMLIFVSPSNPTGTVYTPEEIQTIGKWAAKHEIWVMTDEIYQHLVYPGNQYASILNLVPDLAERCVIVSGVAKTYAMTGWRVGWTVGPKNFTKASINLQSHMTSNVSNVAQRAALAAISGSQDIVKTMLESFDKRRQTMVKMLNDIDGVNCPMPGGAFYAYPSVKGLLGKTFNGKTINSSMELAEFALDEANVALVPGEAFGTPGYVRMSYALGDDDLIEGVARLQKLFS
ncbi:MAG: pyridoxal phosphate-dependent aminotransferase [Candidatus Nanopelagicales bacterium]|jgi:aspartate/methionine/tyrosine aminotransferase